jgi:putative endonuclease
VKSDLESIVYILTNKRNTVLYVGRTSDLIGRLYEHRHHLYPHSFTTRYQLYKLVYFEECEDYGHAVQREHQLKAGSRKKKIDLIQSINPNWNDLAQEWDIEE